MQRIVKTSISLVALYLIGGTALDRFVFPESAPDESYYPPVGYVFTSESEGFEQRILKREEGLFWLEVTLHSDAPGPPEHIHTSFSERFMVAEGTLSLLVNGEVMELGPSESFLVEPGTPHKPFNQTNQPVVVRGPLTEEYGIPEPFSVFLIQAYGFFDEEPTHQQPPAALLQMSRFSPVYDSWLADPPVAVQRLLFQAIGPTARLLGYRTYYPRFKPGGVAKQLSDR